MKKALITSTAFLLAGAMLLGGCSKRESGYAPGTGNDQSSISSESGVSEVLSESSSVSGSSGTESSTEQSSDVSAAPVPVVFTDEDREVQKIFSELKEPAKEIYSWLTGYDHITDLKFRYPDDETETHEYGLFDAFSDRFETPKTCSEMKSLMLEYFSADRTDIFLSAFAVCNAVKNPDGTYTLSSYDDKPLSHKQFVEIDGKLYRDEGVWATAIIIDTETIKVTDKTDDLIEFTYLNDDYTRIFDNSACLNDITLYRKYSLTGTLKYERGGWKLDKWEF